MARLYDPINVYKPFAEDIGIVDGPLEYLTAGGITLPLPTATRMTVVRLSGGELFLHSPIAYDRDLADKLRALGTVRHLVAPNQFHSAHVGEWQKAFPGAVAWASPRVRRARAQRNDVHFDTDLALAAPQDWSSEIDQILFPGGYFEEFIFFHRPSRTLIVTDTIINIEPDKIAQPWRAAVTLARMTAPHGGIFFGMRVPILLQQSAAKAAKARICSWQPERIVLSHGRCFTSNAAHVIDRLFG